MLVLACCGSDDGASDSSASDGSATNSSAPSTTSPTEVASDPTGSSSTGYTADTVAAADPDENDDEVDDGSPAADELPLPTSAAELTTALDEAERALRRAGADQADAAPWGRRQQALYRVLAFNPDWADEAISGVDPTIRDAVELNWVASRSLAALVDSQTIADTLPAWRIVPPPPADELVGHYREAEAQSGVPWSILAAIHLIETRMGRIEGVSTAGAVGPMQFLPTTWDGCCEGDPTVARDAILGAGRYLVQRGADRDLDRAIFGYNNSDHYVTAVTSFAAVLDAEPDLYRGYHAWQVYFRTTEGVVVLPEGYDQASQIPADEWLAANPDGRFPWP